jgi:hypothetical protein
MKSTLSNVIPPLQFISTVNVGVVISTRCLRCTHLYNSLIVHPILKHKYYSALNIDRIPIKLSIVTGTYVLQTKRLKCYRDESDPTCLLCGNTEENIQHFILDCQKLEFERTKILMEISVTWQNIQNCEMSFTELDSISQLQILLDSSNYNKVKIDPTNATRIELLAIRLLFRLHIRAKLLEFDVKR